MPSETVGVTGQILSAVINGQCFQ